jgi:S1-C subfamily serine protease
MTLATILALALVSQADPPPSQSQAKASPADVVAALEEATIEAIARAQPSVVAIARIRGEEPDKTTAIRGQAPDRMPMPPQIKNARLQRFDRAAPGDFSSGVVIGPGNEILTTFHTLKGSSQIWVRSADRREFEAEILAADPRSDLAVIAPRASAEEPPVKLTPIKVGDSTRLRPGSFLIALGNSFNAARDGKASAGMGILANTARKVHAPNIDEFGTSVRGQSFRHQPTLLQLDAKLNLGMSGGAVVTMKGELVGMTTAAASPVAYDVQAGYAIPMDALGRRVVDTLKEGKEVEYGFLGIGLDPNVPNGVSNVTPGTPADRAGLVADDIILAVNDHDLDTEDGLTMALSTIPPGQTASLKINRRGDLVTKTILVSKYPVMEPPIATNRPKPWRGLRVDFTSVLNPTAVDIAQSMANGGVGIVSVETGSAAETAGLRKNLVITAVDGQAVPTPADFLKAVASKDGKDVTLTTALGPISGQKVVVGK